MDSFLSKIADKFNIRDNSKIKEVPEVKMVSVAKKTNTIKEHENKITDSVQIEKDEIVIALVAAVGCDLEYFNNLIKNELDLYGYSSELIRISSDFLSAIKPPNPNITKLGKISHFMTSGNEYRNLSENNSALAYAAISEISKRRSESLGQDEPAPLLNKAWIIRSLKNPEEVVALRKSYGDSLFVVGIYSSFEKRRDNLVRKLMANEDETMVDDLIKRDADEGPSNGHGQHTSDTFHLSDFFIDADKSKEQNAYDVERIFQLVFSNPYITPTFDEYAMYMAFSASTRSADLSRQVGAVLCKDSNILSTGANDVPKANGGLYWPQRNEHGKVVDTDDGRDYTRNGDANKAALSEIIDDLIEILDLENTNEIKGKLKKSKLNDITEYGRIVHAEMEAILSCGRSNNSTVETALYCTTFPCHNCAKHIIAAGIKRVIYVEPYSKSRATDFHSDSVTFSGTKDGYISFEPFVGVGPRSFLNLFSMKLGNGYDLKRKDKEGKVLDWRKESAILRMQPDTIHYIQQETIACLVAAKDQELYIKNN
jgi:deoxycytidylate deaminase